jgi:CubicO group peptidase (beta-lactamase class C family)
VLQQVITEVTGLTFDKALRELVFEPLGMHDSSFDQEFPLTRPGGFAYGHRLGGLELSGGYRVFPEAASSGLWTTAGDLARLSCAIRAAALGQPADFLSQALATEMVSQASDAAYGLGSIALRRDGRSWYGHSGDGAAFQCLSLGTLEDGNAVVVMANIGGDLRFATDLLTEVQITLPANEVTK